MAKKINVGFQPIHQIPLIATEEDTPKLQVGIPQTGDIEKLRSALVARSQIEVKTPKKPVTPNAKGLYQVRTLDELPKPPKSISFTQAIDPEAANIFLKSFGYPAQINMSEGRAVLAFEGGTRPVHPLSLKELTRALAQSGLKGERNPSGLAEIARLLEAGRTDRTWTEGNHDASKPADFLEPRTLGIAQTAVEPEFLGAPFELTTVTLPIDQVEVAFAPMGKRPWPPELRAYAEQVIKAFDNGDGTFTFPVHNQQLEQVYPGAKDVGTITAQPTSSDRTMAMGDIRLKLDLGQIQSVNSTKPLTPEDALHDMGRWVFCQAYIDRNPNLRLYCATQPEVVAFADKTTGIANLARSIAPYPAHPQHTAGTHAVSLKSLLMKPADGEPMMLQTVIQNRRDQSQDPLDNFNESFIRPLIKTFRHFLDDHGIALFNLHEKNLSYETDLEFGATGRMVLNDFGDVYPDEQLMRNRGVPKHVAQKMGQDTLAAGILPLLDEPRNLLHYGINTLYDSIGAMASAFQECEFEGAKFTPDQIRAAVSDVLAQEMRYLKEDTAKYLGNDHKLASFVHHIPQRQQATLTGILDQVTARTKERRFDQSKPKAVAVVDLDLCGLTPTARAEAALAKVGEQFGITEFSDPQGLPSLPAYHAEGFSRFLADARLGDQYDVNWDDVQKAYENAFFDKSLLTTDQITKGLGEFVRRIDEEGGKVAFVTGRREVDKRATMETLRKAGITNPYLFMMPTNSKLSVEDAKAEHAKRIGQLGEVIAIFDDLHQNRSALAAKFPGASEVEVQVKGFMGQTPVEGNQSWVQNFEWDARPTSSVKGDKVGAVLSGSRSVGDVGLGSLSLNQVGLSQGVTLSADQATQLVDNVVTDAMKNADKLAQNAIKATADMTFESPQEEAAYRIHYILTRKPYIKGRAEHFPWEDAKSQIMEAVTNNRPVSFVLPSFPIKEDKDLMKALGHLPDLGEMGAFIRVKEMNAAISQVYEPGVEFTALMDGHHYRPAFGETPEMIDEYMAMLQKYVDMIGANDIIKLVDYDDIALEKGGPELMKQSEIRYGELVKEYETAFAGLDVGEDPIPVLDEACRRDPAVRGDIKVDDLTAGTGERSIFKDLFNSLIFSSPVPTPKGVNRQQWSQQVLQDIFNVHDPKADPELLKARKSVLRNTFRMTYEYMATIRKDRELKFSSFAKGSIRGTIHPKPGQYGYALLGSKTAHLTPWHGSAVITPKSEISVDFAASLQSQGHVPVHVPWLGDDKDLVQNRQPFAFVPVQMVDGDKLSSRLMKNIRLMH